jgi:hypothetical protein
MALVPDAVYEYTKTRKENGFPYSNQKIFSDSMWRGITKQW